MNIATEKIQKCIVDKSTVLDLSNLQLKQIPSIIADMKHLKRLYLSNNSLTELPADLPEELEVLQCSANRIRFLPEKLPSTLRTLRCTLNRLTSLSNLPAKLTKLYCCYNGINELPDISLKILHCTGNPIKFIPDIMSNSLQELGCSFTQIKRLPDLPNIRELVFSFNNIVTFSDLSPSITHIDGSYNRLIELPPISSSLRVCKLAGNDFLSIPTEYSVRLSLSATPDYHLIVLPFKNIYQARKRIKRLIYCEILQTQIDEYRYRPKNGGYLELALKYKNQFNDL